MTDPSLDRLVQLAREHRRAGRDPEATALYQAILAICLDQPHAHYQLGLLACESGRLTEALPHLRMALEGDPSETQHWQSYIETLQEADHAEAAEAIQALAQARNQGVVAFEDIPVQRSVPDSSTEPSLPDSAPTKPLSAKSVKKTSLEQSGDADLPAPSEFEALAKLFQAQRFEEVEHDARRLTQRYPRAAQVWKIHGAVLERLGRNETALRSMQTALSLDPHDHETLNNLGVTLMHLGRLDEALDCFRQATELAPEYGEAYFNAGNVLHEMQRLVEAEEAFRHILRIQPMSTDAYNNLGNVLKQLGRLNDAEASYRQALAIKPDFAESYHNLGIVLKIQRRWSEAETCFRQALSWGLDNSPEPYNSLGNVLEELGRLSEAEASYLQAWIRQPNAYSANNNLAMLYQRMGRWQEAESYHRQAQALSLQQTNSVI